MNTTLPTQEKADYYASSEPPPSGIKSFNFVCVALLVLSLLGFLGAASGWYALIALIVLIAFVIGEHFYHFSKKYRWLAILTDRRTADFYAGFLGSIVMLPLVTLITPALLIPALIVLLYIAVTSRKNGRRYIATGIQGIVVVGLLAFGACSLTLIGAMTIYR